MPASPFDEQPNILRRFLPEVLGILFFVFATYWLRQGSMLNHDTSWYLISTGWWLDGARIGEDIIELNPPLAFYLTAPAVLLARLMNWEPAQALLVYVIAISFVSVAWFSMICARCHSVSSSRRRALLAGVCLALFLVSLKDFAQREFLLILFALPYLALVSLRPDSHELTTVERVLIGFFATLGLALKPYFLLLPAAMILVEIVRRRSLMPVFEPQNLAIAVGCVGYLLAAFFLHPTYFEKTVPMALLTYAAFGYAPITILVLALPVCLACLFALYGLSKLKGQSFYIGLRLLVAALAGLMTFFVQFKGWTYQLVPAVFLTFVACFWIVMELLTNRSSIIRASAIALATVVFLTVVLISRGTYQNQFPEALGAFFESEPDERSFLAMTTNVSVSFPMANMASAEPVSRSPALWIIPGAVSRLALEADLTALEIEQLNEALAYARQTTVDDFVRGVPELVIVDARAEKPYFQGVAFDYLAFFQTDPAFAELWQNYHLVGTALGFDVYRWDG